MSDSLSPLQLRFLLSCYTNGDGEYVSGPLQGDFAQFCLDRGIIEVSSSDNFAERRSYKTTDLGSAWVKSILRTRIPSLVMKHFDQFGQIIE